VTADHILDLVQGDQITVRMNSKSGGSGTVKLRKAEKISGLHKADDLALFNVPAWHDVYETKAILLDRDEYNRICADIWRPHVGDEIATVGLYSTHYGELKNIPVARIGHIAMLPDEPVLTQRGEYLRAYLVEVRSIIGLSGSPVFINMPETRVVDGKIQTREGPGIILIGMMLGYHLVSSAQDQIVVPLKQRGEITTEYSLDERNTGFGVVLPIERIFSRIEQEDFCNALDECIGNAK
jgi:hypothetical protein